MRKQVIAAAVLVSGVLGGLVGAGLVAVWDSGTETQTVSAPTSAPSQAQGEDERQETSLSDECVAAADVYEQVRPAVVQVTSSGAQFEGTGTGVVIDADGHILTNNHVISGATNIEVRFADGSTASAEVAGRDPANDLAVIDVVEPLDSLAVAELGDSDSLRVGDTVLALGNPFDLEGTLTEGIVSALDRTYATGENTRPIRGMIQTDAAVNPGNSGGPLLNCRGEVVGINTLLENPSGQNVNVGVAFAVAINTAKGSLPQMLAGDTVSHPWLGIAGVDVTPALAEEVGIDAESGVYVTLVSESSPAEEAGLQAAFQSAAAAGSSEDVPPGGDVILAVDGNQVTGIEELAAFLAEEKRPGDSVELRVLRDGGEVSVQAQLAEWPA